MAGLVGWPGSILSREVSMAVWTDLAMRLVSAVMEASEDAGDMDNTVVDPLVELLMK